MNPESYEHLFSNALKVNRHLLVNVICLAGVLVLGKWFCPVATPAARSRRWEGWLQSLLSVFWKAGFLMCTFLCRRTSCQSTLHFQTLRPSVWVLTDSSWLEESQPSSSLGPGGFTPQVTFPCWPRCHLLRRHPEQSCHPPETVTLDICFSCVFRNLVLFTNTLSQIQQGHLKILLPPASYLSPLPKITDPVDLRMEYCTLSSPH